MVTPPTQKTKYLHPLHPDYVIALSRALVVDDLTVPDPNHKSTQGTPPAPAVSKPSTSTFTTVYKTISPCNQLVQSIILFISKSKSTPYLTTLEPRSGSPVSKQKVPTSSKYHSWSGTIHWPKTRSHVGDHPSVDFDKLLVNHLELHRGDVGVTTGISAKIQHIPSQ